MSLEEFENNPENKVVISCAMAGAATSKDQNPSVPISAEEFGDECKKAYDAGGSQIQGKAPVAGDAECGDHPAYQTRGGAGLDYPSKTRGSRPFLPGRSGETFWRED